MSDGSDVRFADVPGIGQARGAAVELALSLEST